MADTRKMVKCTYCGAAFHLKWAEDEFGEVGYCVFCGEDLVDEELEDDKTPEEDDYEEGAENLD